jgi:YVTN family beta-propeller protein
MRYDMIRRSFPRAALGAAVFLACVACSEQTPPPADPRAPSTPAAAEAVQGGAYRVYVTNESSGDLTVIDARKHTVVKTLPLGKRPRGVRVSADGRTLYVALSGSPLAPPGVDESTLPPADKAADGIGVLDAERLELRTILRGFSDPEQIAVSADGSRLYIASEDTGTAFIAEGADGAILQRLKVGGEPEGITMSPDGKYVYVTSEEDHRVAVIDTAARKVIRSFETGKRPRDIAFSPDGRFAYVSGETDASLTIVDAAKHEPVARVVIPGENVRPMGVVASPDGSRVYVATGRGRSVVAIDAHTHAVINSALVGERPWGIAISPDGKLLYTANGPSNDVSIVDAQSLKLLGKIAAGQRPWGVAVGPAL